MGSKFLVVVCWVFMAGDNSGFNLEQHMKTGWPPGLLQDDERKLSRWFASRPDARYQLRKNMMYFNKHPDGSMTRKLVEDWTEEEKALDLRHKAFLKEAEELGYVVRLNTDTLKYEVKGQDPMPLFDDWNKDWTK